MNEIHDFTKIDEYYQIYNVQAYVFHIKESLNYFSMILMDMNKQTIELIAFGNDVNLLKQMKPAQNNWYLINHIKTIPNNKYKRTNHCFKLKFVTNKTKINKTKTLEILENDKIYILDVKQIEKNIITKTKQLSILNFMKYQ